MPVPKMKLPVCQKPLPNLPYTPWGRPEVNRLRRALFFAFIRAASLLDTK